MVHMKQMFVTDNYQDEGHGHEILFLPLIWPVNPGKNVTLLFISCMNKRRYLHMTCRESEK